ncbi:MAG: DNA gyrase/topoisomerase IV subunit A [Christensenellales bacterium]|jgi:DNA gyrase subunit A
MARKKDTTGMGTQAERLLSVTMEEVMHNSMMPYAEYVILDRAIPRVEDGLKPVQRRILYTMMELSLMPDKPHRKSARIVGDCLGKYHPHGDTSVYDAMVRMAQPFNMSAQLVDGHGNFGSMDGDPAAAMRYTEARMTPLALELLRDIDKDTVEFSLNFDDTLKEPDVLPGRFPNLLVNGATGIAVGLATNIPPHNLGEAIDATVAMLQKPNIAVKELMQYLPGPDFPTGGLLLNTEEIAAAYETGRGRLVLRAKTHIEPLKNGKSLIVVTEFPYQVNKAAAQEKILRLSESKKTLFAGIADIREESDRNGTRVVIEVKKDADPEKILNYLYKYSDLQVNFGVNLVAIADGKPKQMGLKEVLSHYIDHQKDVVTRRTRHDLDAAERRAHVLEGLIVAVDHVDEVIRLIRASDTPAQARDGLMKRYSLTQIQAQAILDMRLARLTSLQIIELRAEYDEVVKLIAELKSILEDPKKLLAVIRRELLEIKKKYAVPRRTALIDGNPDITVDESELKVVSDVTVYATASGIKRVGAKVFAQKGSQEEGRTFFALDTRTDKRVQFFTNQGRMFSIDAEDIPEPKGKQLGSLPAALFAGWNDDEHVVAAFSFDSYPEDQNLLFFTKMGRAKRASLAAFETRSKKFTAIGLKEGDEVLSVVLDKGLKTVLMITAQGMSIRFPADTVPQMGRTAAGVKAIALEEGDLVLFADQVPDDAQMLLISDLGYAKRSLILDYECQKRNGKGQRTFEFRKNGANGTKLAVAILLEEPATFAVEQLRSGRTVFASEEVLVEKRQSRGLPLVMAMLDDVVIDAYIADERTQKG